MEVKLRCPSCAATCRGNIPEGKRRVKCPRCSALIDVPPPPPAEEEIVLGELVEEGPTQAPAPAVEPAALPMVLPVPEPAAPVAPKAPAEAWDLLRPRTFGIFPRRIRYGVAYDLVDPNSDDELGWATEEVSSTQALAGAAKMFIGAFGGREMMDGTIAVVDGGTQQMVLLIERGSLRALLPGAKPCKVKLWGPRDELLARFAVGKPGWGGLFLDFDGNCRIFDGYKRAWLNAEGQKYRTPDYAFRTGDGKAVARVRGKGETRLLTAKAGSWTGRGGWLKLSLRDGFDPSPSEKLILLGTAIAIEAMITTVSETKPSLLGGFGS